MKNYFEFYGLEPDFQLDEQVLRRKFLQLSKEYHPDFYGLESDEKQAEALELSTYNNEAYKTLSDFEKRFAYILNLHGLLDEEKNKKALPQSFLMEMMDINEALMELEFDFDNSAFSKVEKTILEFKEKLNSEIKPSLEKYPENNNDADLLNNLLTFYLKNRYLKRLLESLDKIKSANV